MGYSKPHSDLTNHLKMIYCLSVHILQLLFISKHLISLFYADAGSHHAAHDNLRLRHRGGTSRLSPVYLSLKRQTTHQAGGSV